MARALDDAVILGEPRRLVALERACDIGFRLQRRHQRGRVVRRLRHAGRHVRARHECRIAEDRHPAERHVRRLQIVDRLQDRLLDQPHDLAELRRQQPLGIGAHFGDRLAADQRRRDRDRMRGAALVGEQPLQFRLLVGRPVPHHIVAAMAGPQIVVRARHRIAEKLLARRQPERHEFEQLAMGGGRNGAFRDQRAPGGIAGIERRRARQGLLAHGGADAVGAHQQVRMQRFAVGKMRRHRIRALGEAGEPASAVIARGRKGVPQQAVHALPGGEHLRAMHLLGQPALPVENLAGGDGDAERVGGEPQPTQPLDELVLGNDAGAAAGQFALHALVDVYVPPGPAQHQRAQQAAHRAADDNRNPRPRPGQLNILNLSVFGDLLYMTPNSHRRNPHGSDHAR